LHAERVKVRVLLLLGVHGVDIVRLLFGNERDLGTP